MQQACRSRRGFTLIELLVVMTIIGILFVGSYVPYDYYSRLSKIRISAEKIHQSMEDAKILAQNGQLFPGTTKNADIGLLFRKWAHTVDMFAYMSGSRNFAENDQAKLIKTISLEDGVYINNIPDDARLIEYKAPRGEMEIYSTVTATGSDFDVGIGWKTVTEGALYRTITIER